MKFSEIIREGGWDTTATQGTVITPAVVKTALSITQQFVNDFNRWLKQKDLGPVEMGKPTGSSAHHAADSKDDPTKVYGDVDLQMIAPPVEGVSYGQFTAHWNKLADEFVKQVRPAYVHNVESKPGHPIVQISKDSYVQVDFMWHEERLRDWGASRVTPERGLKGSLYGNMFSTFGEVMDMSIQHAGVQLKVVDNQRVPFSKQKDTQLITVTINPKTWIYDIFRYEYQDSKRKPFDDSVDIDPLLKQFPGTDTSDPKVEVLVRGVQGFARSCELNDMFGQGDLAKFSSADDFLNKFLARYEEKAMIDLQAKKRDKATTPEAQARAAADKDKILKGLEKVKGMFR